MPLPASLAAKLAKRGILQKTSQRKRDESKKVSMQEVEEEVFAEDYDEPDLTPIPGVTQPEELTVTEQNSHTTEDDDDESLIHETTACPNKSNRYHDCSDYCIKRWGHKGFNPSPIMERKRLKMLKKYPITDEWEEVGDPETGRYYYWNAATDEVSWLPPTHPKTKISLSADRLKELFETKKKESESEGDEDEGDIMDIDDFEEIERKILMEKSAKEKEKRRDKPRREETLDPMDPAAYSDIPRGTWSTGLDKRGSAKTGVDSSASGPLYQQRPYPSPGAILRMNKELSD